MITRSERIYRAVPGGTEYLITVVLRGSEFSEYVRLKGDGFKTSWCGDGKICLTKREVRHDNRIYPA